MVLLQAPEKVRAWFQFFRVGGITSAVSGSLWGWSVSTRSEFPWTGVLPILLVSCCLYLFGMGLNDLVDLEKDREFRPERPLPSGRLEVRWAKLACAQALVLGLVVSFFCLQPSQWLCFFLAFGLVGIYNFGAKRSESLGPWTVGLARALNALAGMSFLQWEVSVLGLGLLHLFHTLAIFQVARGEDREIPLGWYQSVVLALSPALMMWFAPMGGILWALWLVWVMRSNWGGQERSGTAKLVGSLVGAFSLMEACFLLGSGLFAMGLVFLALYLAGRWFQKAFPAG